MTIKNMVMRIKFEIKYETENLQLASDLQICYSWFKLGSEQY